MNPLRRPRLWARIVGTVAVLIAAWVLFVPVTVVYTTSDANPAPREITRIYSWWTTEQDLVYSDPTGADKTSPEAYIQQNHLTNSIRLDCGNIVGAGPHEQLQKPEGPTMCAQVRKSHRIVGLLLLALGVIGLLTAGRLPAEPEKYRNRYRQSWSQRRLLRRGR